MANRDFDKDRRICEAATKGPLEMSGAVHYEGKNGFRYVFADENNSILAKVHGVGDVHCNANTEFIVEAREGWPAALDEVKRLSENIHAYAYESGRVSLKCQDQSKEIESLKRQLQVAAEQMAPRCPYGEYFLHNREKPSFCTCADGGECNKKSSDCWIEYWRQKAGEGAK